MHPIAACVRASCAVSLLLLATSANVRAIPQHSGQNASEPNDSHWGPSFNGMSINGGVGLVSAWRGAPLTSAAAQPAPSTPAGTPTPQASPSEGVDSNAGAKLVQSSGCAGCHGVGFQGGVGPKLYGIEHRLMSAQIADAIKHPRPPMPDMGFSDAQVRQIVSYLSNLDGGSANTAPVVTLDPATPTERATLTVRFPGTPQHVTAQPTMQMGSGSMHTDVVTLHPTSDPHVWQGEVRFSMAGPWMIELIYDGKTIEVPVSVAGAN